MIQQELEEADGTTDLLMRLREHYPAVATERKRGHLAIMLDGDPYGPSIVYVGTQVLIVGDTEHRADYRND